MKQLVIIFGVGFLITILTAILIVELVSPATPVHDSNTIWTMPLQNISRIQSIFLLGILWSFLNPLQNHWSTRIRLKLGSADNWRFYCIGGIFTSVFAHLILAGAFGWKMHQAILIVMAALPGGAAGAYMYSRWQEKFQSE